MSPVTQRRVALLTREYPPEVYGGAGVHVEYLARELRKRTELSVQAWGAPRSERGVTAHQPWAALAEPKPEAAAFQAMSINLAMAAGVKGVELVHSHTKADAPRSPHRDRARPGRGVLKQVADRPERVEARIDRGW